jgi:general secretion pathway protein G
MKRKKRPVTLLEIMVVILLIALIGSVVGYNMKGSMEKGKSFKTKQAVERIKEILYLEYYSGVTTRDIKNIGSEWTQVIEESGLAKNQDALFKDGWGNPFTVSLDDKGDIKVVSPRT